MNFEPDYTHIEQAARNRITKRLPLYEHNISPVVAEAITGKPLISLFEGDFEDQKEYFRKYSEFCRNYGYDIVPFEGCITDLVQGGEGLCGRAGSLIRTMEDINNYDWNGLYEAFIKKFDPYYLALSQSLPPGMKAVGGVGNGIFELIQDFVPLTELAYLQIDEPDVYSVLWKKLGDVSVRIWQDFLKKWSSSYALCRFGDDLGFRSSTLIQPDDIRQHILPQYKRIISLIHETGKPFLLHSCGCIFSVMDDIIDFCRIDAKHSNEDGIAPFSRWVEEYGDRIGNFGGIEMNVLCLENEQTIREYVNNVLETVGHKPGIAIGSGNQIADYIPPEGFIAMTETVRKFRGE